MKIAKVVRARVLGTVTWEGRSLQRHYEKHPANKDKVCWQEIVGITGRSASQEEYCERAIQVARSSWITYDATELDRSRTSGGDLAYHLAGTSYVDRQLVKVVLDEHRDTIRTCYHEHFDRRHQSGSTRLPFIQLATQFLERLSNRCQCKMTIDLMLRGAPALDAEETSQLKAEFALLGVELDEK